MRKFFSLITALVLCTAMWGAESSFYNLPKGAFGCGMTSTGAMPVPFIVAPYIYGDSSVWTSTTGAGQWILNSKTVEENAETYTMPVSMKGKYNIPMLVQEGKKKFQFGIKSAETYRTDTYFYVGDSALRYITPALMYTDLVTSSSGAANNYIANYKTTDRNTMGVYFNNIDVMYITGISIPIKHSSTGATVETMFPSEDAHVIVNIYKATAIGGKTENKADKTTPLWTGTLTKGDFKVSSSKNAGALTKSFSKAITIDGPFVVELSDMKESGCVFYVMSSKVNPGTNKWGYYLDENGVETYPGDYTLAVSVSAMFPVLYGKSGEDMEITIPSTGAAKEPTDNRPKRNIYANYKYQSNSNGWSYTKPDFVSLGVGAATNYSLWYFSAGPNNTDDVRSGDFVMKFRGKSLTYTITQAPMLKSISLSEKAISLEVGKTATLVSTALPVTTDQDTTVTWASNNKAVATVDENGVVTAVAAGKATITATSTVNSEFTATCEVTVTIAPITLYLNTGGTDLWNKDGAKFSAYYFLNGKQGTFTDFLSVTPEDANIFVAAIPGGMEKVIFVRHDPAATSPSWDNKWNQTEDLTISADKDMYTITAWGEDKSPGTWSKYVKITYADTVYYVAGNFTNWAKEMKELPAEVKLPADSTIQFKQVMVRTKLGNGDSIGKDTTWYGAQGKEAFMTRESSVWKLDGAENVYAHTDAKGTYTFSLNAKGEFVLGWPDPCVPGYAIVVNGERKILSKNEDQKEYTEYWIDSLALEVGDKIVLFDTCSEKTFKATVTGYKGLKSVGESDTLQVTEAAYYQFYLKLIYGGDELYVVKLVEPAKTFDLTIIQDTVWTQKGGKVAAWIWSKDKELAGEWTAWATNAKDTLTLKVNEKADSIIFKRFAPEVEVPYWEGSAEYQWNEIAKSEIEDCHLFFITDWDKGAWCERPAVKYYAKNNWNGAAEWSWLELIPSTVDDVYMLDTVVFGGTGVNVNDKADDTDALYFAAEEIVVLNADLDGIPTPYIPEPRKRDTVLYAPAHSGIVLEAPKPLAGDTIKLFFNAADSTLKAFIIGRPAPAPRKEFTFIAGEVAESNPTLFAITWGKDGSNETVKLANKEADIYTAEILETIDSLVLVRCASDAAEIIWDGEGKNVWNQTDNYAICDTMYFEAWVDGSNKFTITCEAPKPVEVKYYITGNAALVGEDKAWNAQAIEMTDSAYVFTELAAGEYEMKITNGAWDPEGQSWGSAALSEECSAGVGDKSGNIYFVVETANDVTVSIANGKVTVIGIFKEEYKYTTYTEWQVKYGPDWEWVSMTKQEDGLFTVEAIWGNTGINIASGENPIKQDWYPLDDAALTVAEDVVEGDNVVISLSVVDDETVALNVIKQKATNIFNVKAAQGQRYNILGLPVNETYHGIVIMNGQTYLQ